MAPRQKYGIPEVGAYGELETWTSTFRSTLPNFYRSQKVQNFASIFDRLFAH